MSLDDQPSASQDPAAQPIPDRPRLRAVEAFPADVEGRRVLGLRDPSNMSEAVLAFSEEAIPILEALDGSHSILDIQVAETQRQGRIVMRSEIEEVVRTLDEALFLQSPRFEAYRNGLAGEYLRNPVRPAYHAGSAYPSDPDALREWLDSFFTGPGGPGAIERPLSGPPIAGILSPHIDFRRGGPVYAWAYRALAEAEPADLYVILGVPHQGIESPAAATLKAYDTPLGPLEVDHDFVEALGRRSQLDLFHDELGHRAEHSIEFEAVFLKHLIGERHDVRIVPLLTSFVHESMYFGKHPRDHVEACRFIEALGETIAAYPGRVCIIGGVDLAHVGPQFGDTDPVDDQTLSWLEGEDRSMLDAVQAGDPDAFYESIAKDRDRRRVCGLTPIYTFLNVIEKQGKLLKYNQAPDPYGTVTFASVAF